VEAQVTKAPTTLEQRLAAALAAERVGVEDARALLSEVEAAIAEAEQAAQQHSDAAEQQRLAQTTELAGERLRTARPRLETRLRDAIGIVRAQHASGSDSGGAQACGR
jgi:predicted deacylase